MVTGPAGVMLTTGVGFTNTVAVIFDPTQVPEVGVIVNVTVTGIFEGLVKEPEILPAPLVPIPVTDGLFLVQVYVVLAVLLLSTIGLIVAPEQTLCDDGVAVAAGVPEIDSITLVALY